MGGVASALIAFGASTMAQAQENDFLGGDFSATLTLTTDYIFRGVSLSDQDPAIQGSFDWAHNSGFYIGVWASNTDIPGGSVEIDYYAGFAGGIDAFSYDLMFIYYTYPGADSPPGEGFAYWELIGTLGYDFEALAVSASVGFTPDNFGGTDDATWVAGGLEVPLTVSDQVTLLFSGNVGYQMVTGPDDYVHWDAGVTISLPWFDADVRYYDTDIKDDPLSNARVVGTISRTF